MGFNLVFKGLNFKKTFIIK